MIKAIYICMIFSICYSLNLTLLDYHDPLAHHILDAEVVDNTLIISAMVQGIEFYDISDPTQLNHISHFTLSSGGGGGGGGTKSNCVTAENGYAYFSSNNGVYVVDISNLNNPINYGSINGTNGLILENLKVKNDLLIVAAHEDGARLYNVSNPTNPIYLSTIPTNNSWTVDIMEGYAFIADEENILVVDISNLSSPEIITEIGTGNAIKDIEIDDNFIYVAIGSDGVHIYDISDPTYPLFLDNYNTTTLANRISAFNGKLAISDWDDVEVIEWDGSNLNLIGYKNTSNRTMAIASKDNYIYSAEWKSIHLMEFGEIEGPDIDVSSTYIIYPFVEAGESFSMYIDIINNGNQTLDIVDSYTTNSEFNLPDDLNDLNPGDLQTIEIIYTASNTNASGSYRILSNDMDQDEIICELLGNIDGANVGETAPDFTLEYVANGDGVFQLSDHIGKIVVLAFFSPM